MEQKIFKKPYEISVWDEKKVPINTEQEDTEAFEKMRLNTSDITYYKEVVDKEMTTKRNQQCSFLMNTSEKNIVLKDVFKNGEYLYFDINGLKDASKVNIKTLSTLKLENNEEISSAYYLKNNNIEDSVIEYNTNGINKLEFLPRLEPQPRFTKYPVTEWTFSSEDEGEYSDSSFFKGTVYLLTYSQGLFSTSVTEADGKYLLKTNKNQAKAYFQQGMKFLTKDITDLKLELPICNSDEEAKTKETGILQIYINTNEIPVVFDQFKNYYIGLYSGVPSEEFFDSPGPNRIEVSLGDGFPSNSLKNSQLEENKLVSFLIPGAYLLKNSEDINEDKYSLKVYQNEIYYFLSNLSLQNLTVKTKTSFGWALSDFYDETNLDSSIHKGNYSLTLASNAEVTTNYGYLINTINSYTIENNQMAPINLDKSLIFLSDLSYDSSFNFYTTDFFGTYNEDVILQIISEGVTENNYPKITLSNSKNGYVSAQDYREKNFLSIERFEEEQLFIIGSDTMESQTRALNPKLVRNINGSNTLSFSMYYQYEDNITGETVLNPYCKYLCNERKIKLKYDDKWYDFVIKNIQENSETKEFIYTAKDLYINELSKNGFELTFDTEKENNIGTITYLGQQVVEGTDWMIDLDSDHLAETKIEPLYKFEINNTPITEEDKTIYPISSVRKIKYLNNEPYFQKENDIYSLVINDFSTEMPEMILLIPYSALKDKKEEFQAFLTSPDVWNNIKINNGIDEDYNLIIEQSGSCIYSIWLSGVEWDEDKIIKLYSKEIVSTEKSLIDYRAEVLVQSQSMKYDSTTGKLVTEYEDEQGRRIYCFEETEFTSPTLVRNLVTNSKNFVDVTGWDAEGNNNIKLDFYDNWLKKTIPYLGLKFPTTYIKNSGIENNRSIIQNFNAGELYVLRIKASKLRPNSVAPAGNKVGGFPYVPSEYSAGARGYMGWSTYWDTFSEDYGGCSPTIPLTNGRGLCGRIAEYDLKNGKYVLKENVAHFRWAHTPDYIPEVNNLIYKDGAYSEIVGDKLFRGVRQSALRTYVDEDGNKYLRYAFRPYGKKSSGNTTKDFLGYNNPLIQWTGGNNDEPLEREMLPFLIPMGEYEGEVGTTLENYKYKYMVAQINKSFSYNDLLNKRVGLFLYTWGPYTWSEIKLSSEEAVFEGGVPGRLIQNIRLEDIEFFPFKTEDIKILGDNGQYTTMKKLMLPGDAPKQSVVRNVYNCYYPKNNFTIEDLETEGSSKQAGEETSRRVYSDGTVVGSDFIDGATSSTDTSKFWGINDEGSLYNTSFPNQPWGKGWIYDTKNTYTYEEIVLSDKIEKRCKSDYDIKRLLTDIYTGSQDLYELIDDASGDAAINTIYKCGWRIAYMIRRFIKCSPSEGTGVEGDPYIYNKDNVNNPQARTGLNQGMTHDEIVIQIRKALDLAGFKLVFETTTTETGKVLNKDDICYIYKGTNTPEEEKGYKKVLDSTYEKKRILTVKESNRFNIIQKLSENFECWAKFTIEHDSNGKISYKPLYNEDGFIVSYTPQKKITFKKFIGKENFAGFNYGVNLKGIQRTVDSEQIVSKVIVKDNTNEMGENGFCTISRADENPTKENILYNFDHYVHQNLLSLSDITTDLYDDKNGLGFYEKLRILNIDKKEKNTLYTEMANSLDTITANFKTYKEAYEKAEEESLDILETLRKMQQNYANVDVAITKLSAKKESSSLNETEEDCLVSLKNLKVKSNYFLKEKEKWEKDKKDYEGKLSALDEEFSERNKKIKALYEAFYAKYSRFIQEGTWHSDDYYDDNQYYLDALNVAKTSASPKVSYNISVIDVSPLEGYEAFSFEVGDKTFITDPEYFGYISNGDLYKEEIVVSETTQMLDSPEQNQIKVQNYTSQFEDLFQRITAATQTLEFNKNSYDRAAKSFTSNQNLK